MPDSREYITRYVKYFNLKAPSSFAQAMILFFIGAISGIVSGIIIHPDIFGDFADIAVSGMSTGIFVISIPALLTVVLIKTVKRKMQLKHAMLSTLMIALPYAILLMIDSVVFQKTMNTVIAYLFLILINAGIYGYWFIVGKFVIGRRNVVIFFAAVQPLLNVLFYIPMESYILNTTLPLGLTLIKLFAGMSVFLATGYAFLFIIDRPVKRTLETSGINLLSAMVGQWLFNLTNDVKVIGYGAGIKRNLNMELLMLRGKKGYKGIFVNPDIHFGPFQGVGGSVAPLQIGDMLIRKYNSAPFVLHGPLDIQDNPIITSQVYAVTKKAESTIGETKKNDFERAYGTLGVGEDDRCRAINLRVGNAGLLLLTKAPYVTEDMTREVGMVLRSTASEFGLKNSILIDAHNSRFESANAEELKGIQKGSSYIAHYQKAIELSAVKGDEKRVSFGASYSRLAVPLSNPKDIGEGYTSVCIFKFGSRKFCVFYFDANNMLPEFRNALLEHVKGKYGMDAEVCTTDTHSINTLSRSASTSLGRYTKAEKAMPIIDTMIKKALKDMEPVSYAYKKADIVNFPVWGGMADKLIESTNKEVRRMLKYVAPLLVVFAFIAAAWAIYVV
jgi:putative membrane protein